MPILADIYYHHYAGGESISPPVVLIHGIGGTHLDWSPDIRRLVGYRMYAVDLPGHGKSRKHGYQSVRGYAESLVDWLDAVGLYRAVFVGHSLGSAIALQLGIYHPERVAGLGLIASESRSAIPNCILEDLANGNTYLKGVNRLIGKSFQPETAPIQTKSAIQRLLESRPSVLYGDLMACNEFDLNGGLCHIQAPTLILCGDSDQITPLRYSQYLVNAIPHAKLIVIPAAGHMLAIERPQAIVVHLPHFLVTVPYLPGQG